MNLTLEQAAERLATQLELPKLVRWLQDVLGPGLVAIIAGVSDTKAVGKWARGERTPNADAEKRLRFAFQVTQLLIQREGDETIRAWFGGMNPYLADRAPALVLAEEPLEVLRAARAFVAYG